MATLRVHVPDEHADRHIILTEYDESHPTETHEITIVGYPGEANNYEVGDTAGVRSKLATGEIVEVGGRSGGADPKAGPAKPGEPGR